MKKAQAWLGRDDRSLVLGEALSPPYGNWGLTPDLQRKHSFSFGTTGTGKSRGLLCQVATQRIRKWGRDGGVIVIDPHGDTVRDILGSEVERGAYDEDPERALADLVYLRWADDSTPALNVLKASHVSSEDIALGVRESFIRAFPELAGAATFEAYGHCCALCLVSNGLPLPLMSQVLTSRALREACLENVNNPATHEALAQLPDNPSEIDRFAGSILRRMSQLNFSTTSFLSLVQPGTVLPLRDIMDEGRSVLIDLGGVHSQAVKSFLAATILTSLETAAQSREGIPEEERKPLLVAIDEFPSVAPRSAQAVQTITAECRKRGISWLALSQSVKQFEGTGTLEAAIENSEVTLCMGVGHESAERLGRMMAKPDPSLVKYEASSPNGRDTYYSRSEQVDDLVETLRHLPARHCVAHVRGQAPVLVRLNDVPDPRPDPKKLAEVRAEYQRRYSATPKQARERAIAHLRNTGLPLDLSGLFDARSGPSDDPDPQLADRLDWT